MKIIVSSLLFTTLFIVVRSVAAIFGTTVLTYFPHFALALPVYFGLRVQTPISVVAVFCVGLLADFASPSMMVGPWAASYCTIMIIVLLVSPYIFSESAFSLGLICFFSAIIAEFIFRVISYDTGSALSFEILQLLVRSFTLMMLAPLSILVFKLIHHSVVKSEYDKNSSDAF